MLACVIAVITQTAMAPRSAHGAEQWAVSERHGNIEIFSQFHVDRHQLLRELHDVESDVRQLLGLPETADTIQLILFHSRQQYLQHLEAHLPHSKSRRALYYKNGSTGQIYVVRSRELMTDVRHEYTHALLHQHLRFLPLWLDEGLAEYYERREAEQLVTARAKGLKWKARFGWRASLTELESLENSLEMTADDYANSWAIVCYLIHRSPGSRQLLRTYVQTIHRGEAPGRFSRFAARDLPDLEMDLNSYFRKPEIRLTSDSPE